MENRLYIIISSIPKIIKNADSLFKIHKPTQLGEFTPQNLFLDDIVDYFACVTNCRGCRDDSVTP